MVSIATSFVRLSLIDCWHTWRNALALDVILLLLMMSTIAQGCEDKHVFSTIFHEVCAGAFLRLRLFFWGCDEVLGIEFAWAGIASSIYVSLGERDFFCQLFKS